MLLLALLPMQCHQLLHSHLHPPDMTGCCLQEMYLDDCGLKKEKIDELYGAFGYISVKLRSDWTHFNAYGYYSKGVGIYKKGVELGYWE